MSRKIKENQDELPTNPGGKSSGSGGGSRTDNDYLVGQLMVENIHHRRRIEVVEARLKVLETAPKNDSIAPRSSLPPAGRQRLFAIIRKTVTVTVVGIAAVISALRELGFLSLH
jgi:hypothetical protein